MEENNKSEKGKMFDNIKPYVLTTTKENQTEEQRAIRSKGGQARAEQLRKRKSMREDLEELLRCKVSKEYARGMIGDDVEQLGDDINVQRVLLVRASQEASQGNMKAMEFLRDTVGDSPKQQLEIQADVMTDADRALIDKLSGRIG